jgi:hypothetical protein
MFKVIDEVVGTAVKVEIIGKPYQYQVRIGKVGTWKIARGRTAGQIKTGEKWERPQYYGSLKQAIEGTLNLISETEGIPENAIVLTGSDAWKVLIEVENRRMALVQGIHDAYQKLLDEHGKDLAGLSKLLAGKGVTADESEEEESEELEGQDHSVAPSLCPKLEARLAQENQ